MTKQEAIDKIMTYDKRIERLERYAEKTEELLDLVYFDFNPYPIKRDKNEYYDVDYEIGKEICDALGKILDRINSEVKYIKREAAA